MKLERYRYTMWLNITHWPDIKGIETMTHDFFCLELYYTLTRYKGDWNIVNVMLFSILLNYTLTRYKGDWNKVSILLLSFLTYYTLTRYKGDWNEIFIRILDILVCQYGQTQRSPLRVFICFSDLILWWFFLKYIC